MIDKLLRFFVIAFDLKCENGTAAVREIFLYNLCYSGSSETDG